MGVNVVVFTDVVSKEKVENHSTIHAIEHELETKIADSIVDHRFSRNSK